MVMNIVDERSKARKVVEDTNFDYLIMFLICMDAVVLGLLTVGFADVNFVTTLFLLDRLCMAIFIVEMLIKMYAYGPRFFKSGWNVFDLVVITVSSLPVASCLIVLRTFRLFRLLRYVNRFKPMKNIINIFLMILPNFAAMAAVLGMEDAKIEEILSGISGAYIANYNCPGQIVITGYEAAVAEASEKLKEAGAKRVLPLNVSGPFHSPMMEAASQGLTEALEGVGFMELKIPYVTNVTGQYVRDTALTRGLLIQQVASGVRWQQSIEAMIADGVDTFVEIGPGRTLTGFLRKINRDVKGYNIRTYEEMHQVCETLL